jgi:membrane-associated phospholipid phosphatase
VAQLDPDPASPRSRQTYAHEIVHACLAATGHWPAWFHEGLAQKLSGETLAGPKKTVLKQLAQAKQVPGLMALGQSWSRMSSGHAAMAYAMALYGVELFYEHHKEYGIRNLIRNPGQLPRIAADLDSRMRAE